MLPKSDFFVSLEQEERELKMEQEKLRQRLEVAAADQSYRAPPSSFTLKSCFNDPAVLSAMAGSANPWKTADQSQKVESLHTLMKTQHDQEMEFENIQMENSQNNQAKRKWTNSTPWSSETAVHPVKAQNKPPVSGDRTKKTLFDIQAEEQENMRPQDDQKYSTVGSKAPSVPWQGSAGQSAMILKSDQPPFQSTIQPSMAPKTNTYNQGDNTKVEKKKSAMAKQETHAESVMKFFDTAKTEVTASAVGSKAARLDQTSCVSTAPVGVETQGNGTAGPGSEEALKGWCVKQVQHILSSQSDAPIIDSVTFVELMMEFDSLNDVSDIIKQYLGDSKECDKFSNDFIQKRKVTPRNDKESTPSFNISASQLLPNANSTKQNKSSKANQKSTGVPAMKAAATMSSNAFAAIDNSPSNDDGFEMSQSSKKKSKKKNAKSTGSK